MSAREGPPAVDFFSAESGGRGEVMGREFSAFQPPVKPAPPVALSLRTRESSALALKHIFDQMYSSADSKPSNNIGVGSNRAHENRDIPDLYPSNRDASNAAFPGARNQVSLSGWQGNSIHKEYKIGRADMDSSFVKGQPQVFAPDNFNFGITSMTLPLVQNSNPSPCQTGFPQAVSRPSASSPSLKQATAQLTIFYSGTVNVYNDVPADKANAIMLLAGTGNPCSTKPAHTEGEKEQALVKLGSPSPPAHAVAPPLPADAMASSVGTLATSHPGKTTGFNLPSTPNMISNTPSNTIPIPSLPPSAASMATEPKPQAAPPKRSHAGIELPQARKASLARFLEKRKDRVQVKQQEPEASPQGEGKDDRNEIPPSPKKACFTGRMSPMFKQ